MKINQILPLEAKFTEVLASIAVMPKMLYYYGKMPEKHVKTVAIVGARKNTDYGYDVAYEAAYELAKRGVVIVSGLALGIDSVAHRAALDAGGVTVAVLGTPIEKIYPARHIGLAREIVEKGGMVMSEYREVDKINYRVSFLQRNRIISGLSDVVIVAEAAERSGSLNTATHALEQGREVFAVPGDIRRETSKGCNRLIMQGAQPYTGVGDVLSVLFPEELSVSGKRGKRAIVGDNEAETTILRAIYSGMREGEAIVDALKMGVAEFNRTITLLEIKGRVRGLGGNRWGFVK
ncbi:DNA-processing protein DprA [Candidatus Saccharibacteria bacterium]|nr:DNA-processing protein DprA [Candidatus Saccharibacteria bacterium]